MSKHENKTQRQVIELLTALGIFCWRQNNHATKGRRFVGKYGVSDIIAIPKGKPSLWIEVKGFKGKQSDEQVEFERRVKSAGHWYVVITSVDDLIEFLRGRRLLK